MEQNKIKKQQGNKIITEKASLVSDERNRDEPKILCSMNARL
jgi:hypothetical protein